MDIVLLDQLDHAGDEAHVELRRACDHVRSEDRGSRGCRHDADGGEMGSFHCVSQLSGCTGHNVVNGPASKRQRSHDRVVTVWLPHFERLQLCKVPGCGIGAG
jgi:hypothetical protein